MSPHHALVSPPYSPEPSPSLTPAPMTSRSTPLPNRSRHDNHNSNHNNHTKTRKPDLPPLPLAQTGVSTQSLPTPKHPNIEPSPTSSTKTATTARVDLIREPRLHQSFQYVGTPAGRLKPHRVGFAEYGALDNGHPAIVIGGHGCSRLVGVMFEELALRHGIRMIWPERPGYGLSEECSAQDFTALEWAEVVIQLADHLNIRKFSLIAQSVGTVFALAVAHKYPARVLGPIFLISPWVSTQVANTWKWSRRLPAALVTRTVSLAMDVMWMFNKNSPQPAQTDEEEVNSPRGSSSVESPTSPPIYMTLTAIEEDELLASLDDEPFDLPTDFPPHRPLRHSVRPRHMSLYFAMNRQRMAEPYSAGQLLDVLVALEKYHSFGFSYSEIRTPVTAVWGDKDGLIPQRAIDTLATLHDVRLKILDGEGHDLVWKEGVMEWAIRGISERWRGRLKRLTRTLSNRKRP